MEATRLGSGRCVRLRRLARLPARPWRRALAGGFNSGNKWLAAHALWHDESGFRAWGTEIIAANLTIAKEQRSACSLACAGVGIMRLQARGARSGVGRKRKELPRGKESQPRHSVCGRGSSAALRSSSSPSAVASLLRQSFGRAAKSATARRGKSRLGRQRKSTALFLLIGRVSLS